MSTLRFEKPADFREFPQRKRPPAGSFSVSNDPLGAALKELAEMVDGRTIWNTETRKLCGFNSVRRRH